MNRNELVKKARAAADRVLEAKGYISAVDVLLAMGRLSKENYERWRARQVPHIEKVLPGSLNEHAFFCRELRSYARELNLKPSLTAYTSWGKGRRQPLRFTKYGERHVEELFSTHYVSAAINDSQKARHTQILTPRAFRLFVVTLFFFALFNAFAASSAGGVKVSDNGRFLVRKDGSPFFWLGDSAQTLFYRLSREDADLYSAIVGSRLSGCLDGTFTRAVVRLFTARWRTALHKAPRREITVEF